MNFARSALRRSWGALRRFDRPPEALRLPYQPHAKSAKAAKKGTKWCFQLRDVLWHFVKEIGSLCFQSPLRPSRPLREAAVCFDHSVRCKGGGPTERPFSMFFWCVLWGVILLAGCRREPQADLVIA